MNSPEKSSHGLPRLVLPFIAFGFALPLWAQLAPDQASPTQNARNLARYDTNKNGVLDGDELAAMRADEAKASAAAQARAGSTAKDEVVTLSPFEVSAGGEKGYSASSSLSGTRLNSKLEDIASSITVVTKQQLLDTAALDINDIFQFEVGTEGTAQFTDPSNDGRGNYDNVSGNPTGANRIRGLAQANILVGGFSASSSIPIDPYNLDGVEIARGPNSTVAGLSDAGGSVNLIQSRGNTSRESSSAMVRADSYGGYRASIDLNRPLIRNKLALRFSSVYDEKGFVRKPSVDRTNRQQVAVTYRPFSKTTLTGSFERFHEFARRANAITPRDTISVWRSRGSPTYDPLTQIFTVNGVRGAPITTITTGVTGNLPSGLTLLGSSNARNLQYIDGGDILYMMKGGNPVNTATAAQQFTESAGDNAAGPLYTLSGTTDKSIYDWTKINIAAPNYQIQSAKIATVNLDQQLFQSLRNRADVNVAWRREDQQDYRRQFIAQQDGVPAVLEIDTNEHLLDGRVNPLFLHPFIGGLAPQVFKRPVFTDSYRSQLAYQLDFSRDQAWTKWIGLHRASGYAEMNKRISTPSGLRYHDTIVDNPNFLGAAILSPLPTSNFSNNNGGLFFPLYYLGSTRGGGVEYANPGPVNPSGKYTTASYFNAATGRWVINDPVSLNEVYFSQGLQKRIVRTMGGSVQSFWLDGRVVTTFGQRKDRTYTIDNLGLNLANGFFDETNLENFGVNKKWKQGETKTKGAVIKPFRGIPALDRTAERGGIAGFVAEAVRGFNVNLSRSDTFLPADTAYNLFIQELPNPTSESKEFGFTLNMFGKLSARLTHHETAQVHTRAGTGTIATRVLGMDFHPGGQTLTFNLFDAATGWQQLANPNFTLEQAQVAAAKQIGYSLDYINNAGGKGFADASDAASKGWELELQFNPNRFWTVKMTGNQQQAVDSNISLFIQKYIDLRLPFWTTIKAPDGSLWWETRQGSNGAPRDYYTLNVQTPLNLAITTQGKRKPQTREYTLNFITNYQLAGLTGLTDRFPWMKNASVGGSYRWSSQGAIGYYAGAPDSDGVVRKLDATRPVYDKARDFLNLLMSYRTKLFSNRIGTTFRLNLNNVNESGRLQQIAVNPDGRAWNYRIIDPRQFILSASFDL
ncbi:MAG: hypothetical protein EXS37_08645 [Opitutus sp.]|nr:hypothetical protein [Opitutus sp.]